MDEKNKLIYTSWDEVKEILPKLNKPKHKSFSSREEAEAFLRGENNQNLMFEEPVAFIDGSYDASTGAYSFGGVFLLEGKEYCFKKKYAPDEYSSMRNVAGEIKGAGYILQFAVRRDIKKLHIYYDYIGIEKWYNGQWQAKSPIAVEYVKFVQSIQNQIEVIFHKVKSHTNNYYNDLADKLAKEALGL